METAGLANSEGPKPLSLSLGQSMVPRCGADQLGACELRYALLLNFTTTMVLDPTLELSVEQLISASNKKIFMECTSLQSTVAPPPSRTLVTALTSEVRLGGLKGNMRCLTR